MKKVKFTQMKDGTKEDYDLLSKYEEKFSKDLPDRVLEALKNLDSSVDVPRRTLPEVGATFDATLAITIKQTNAIKNIFIY